MKTFVSSTLQVLIQPYVLYMVIGCLCLLPTHFVFAGITKCTLTDGTVVFQDSACIVIPKPAIKTTATSKKTTLGIDKSWFEPPSVLPDEAVCTIAGCDCGEHTREFKNGLPMALADALYLDGSWHRLEAILTKMKIKPINHVEFDDLKRERDEAACNILISQQTLLMFGNKALTQLRRQKRYAEDMGWDNPQDCDAGNLSICEHINNIALYDRVLSDIRALANIPRLGNDIEDETAASPDVSAAHDSVQPANTFNLPND